MDDGQHPHRQSSLGSAAAAPDVRPVHIFTPHEGYHSGAPNPLSAMPMPVAISHSSANVGAGHAGTKKLVPPPDGLFPDLAEAKKRKFVLVEDRGSRLRVRVTLNTVDTSEIPDSFRRSNAVCPGSFFPIEMESPPPSPTGRRFFPGDVDDDGDSGFRLDGEHDGDEVEARGNNAADRGRHRRQQPRHSMGSTGSTGSTTTTTASIPAEDGVEAEVEVPRMRKGLRRKQVRLNDLGCRMAWLQSRAFAGRRIFLQKARECPLLSVVSLLLFSARRAMLTKQWTPTAARRAAASWRPCRTPGPLRHTMRCGWGRRSGCRASATWSCGRPAGCETRTGQDVGGVSENMQNAHEDLPTISSRLRE